MHLSVRDSPVDLGRNCFGKELGWSTRLSLQDKCRPTSDSGEKVVYGTWCYYSSRWRFAFCQHFHRDVSISSNRLVFQNFLKYFKFQVLHIHVILGIQNLLRLRIHAVGFLNPDDSHRLRDYSLHVFPFERRRLQMAMDLLSRCSFDCSLRLPLRLLLLFLQNKVSTHSFRYLKYFFIILFF